MSTILSCFGGGGGGLFGFSSVIVKTPLISVFYYLFSVFPLHIFTLSGAVGFFEQYDGLYYQPGGIGDGAVSAVEWDCAVGVVFVEVYALCGDVVDVYFCVYVYA